MGGSTSLLCNGRSKRKGDDDSMLIPIAMAASAEEDSLSNSILEDEWVVVNDRSVTDRNAIAASGPCSPELLSSHHSTSNSVKMIYHFPAHLEQRFIVRKAKCQFNDNHSTDSLIAGHIAFLQQQLAHRHEAMEADSIIIKPRDVVLKTVSVSSKHQSTLSLCNRQLQIVTGDIQFLRQLQTLDLSFNHLCNLPAAIGSLHRLRTLDLSSNRLTILCPDIGKLTNLRYLILKDNHLQYLPDQIGNLKSLVALDVSRNQLERLCKAVARLSNLSKLDLSHNKISYLPIELSFLRQLGNICVIGNPLYNGLMVKAANAMHVQRKMVQSFKDIALQYLSVNGNIEQLPLPTSLRISIANARICSHCSSFFLGRPVYRFRMIRNAQRNLPFVYELCSAHWNSEEERLQSLFTSTPSQIAQSARNFKKQSNVLRQIWNGSRNFFAKQWSSIQKRLPNNSAVENMYESIQSEKLQDRIRALEGERIPAEAQLEILVRRDFVDLVKRNFESS